MVDKRVERVLAVVAAHAGLTDTAEWQIGHRVVQHRLVEAHSAARRALLKRRLGGIFLAEHVQGQRLGAAVDERDGLVRVVDRDDWEDRAKDLLLHDTAVDINAGDHRRGNVLFGLVKLASSDYARGRAGRLHARAGNEKHDHFCSHWQGTEARTEIRFERRWKWRWVTMRAKSGLFLGSSP